MRTLAVILLVLVAGVAVVLVTRSATTPPTRTIQYFTSDPNVYADAYDRPVSDDFCRSQGGRRATANEITPLMRAGGAGTDSVCMSKP